MAVGNVIFVFLTALVAVNLIFAEENPLEPGDFAYDQPGGNENPGPDDRPPNKDDDDNEEKQERTFSLIFGSLLYSVDCNYTLGSNYCLSCSQAVRCNSNNRGVVRNCRGFLRNCNGGRCSFFASSECSSG